MEATIVETKQGKVRGKICEDFKGGKFFSFQGIPYAKPPLGDLRFKAPQPIEHWNDVKDATKESSECLSKHFFFQHTIGSEDCLYLNVYTPKLPKNLQEPMPVMVWIHGGGFTMGSSKTEVYGPDYLMTGDVVLVSMNYRLGILGFLSLEDPRLGVPGNNALKDIVQSLKWVQENIQFFNGDPKNVTIFGESAGSGAVSLLMLSPMTKGLMHRAIMQSGCALNPWVKGRRCAKAIAQYLGLESDDEKEILALLKNVPVKKIFEAQNNIFDGCLDNSVRPHGFVVEHPSTIEPNFLTEHPLDLLKSGNFNKMPIIIGYTNKDGMLAEILELMATGAFKLFSDFETKIPYHLKIPAKSALSKKVADKLKQFYFQGKEPSCQTMNSFDDMQTDLIFYRGIYITIKNLIKSMPEYPIYFYRFSADSEMNLYKILGKITRPGAAHCDDLGYLFKTTILPDLKPDSIEDLLVQRMVRLWCNFARSGNPNPIIEDSLLDVTWKPVQSDQLNFLEIGNRMAQGVDPDIERMAFWDEITALAPDAKDM